MNYLKTYKPLLTIVGLIVLTALIAAASFEGFTVNWPAFMSNWMAGFFLVFSGFKLLNISGFAKGYAKYDLLAMHWYGYGYIYPFMELTLGLLYLQIPMNTTLNMFTLVLMTFSGIGVVIKLAKKEEFQCACLGTIIDVPLTKVTVVEDFGMAIMAVLMLTL